MGSDELTSRKHAVILLSGGLDSMVAGGLAREQGFDLYALTIDYNQRHRIELDRARRIARELDCARHEVLQLDLSRFGGSALTDDIPVPTDGGGNAIPVTYVPARNLIFLSLTLAWAETVDANDIFIGVNALDYSGSPDCRPEFIASFQQTAKLGTKMGDEGHALTIHAPLQTMTKAQIATEAVRLELDPAWSWSCYAPGKGGRACGVCDSCRLRRKGFAEAGVQDGTDYVE